MLTTILVLIALVAACGGGDSDDGAADTTTTVSAPSVTAATQVTAAPTTTVAAPALTTTDAISTSGLGVIRIGATPEAAAEAAGTTLVEEGAPTGATGCLYLAPATGPAGVRFMVSDGQIARIDIDSGGIQTLSGAGIGSTRDQIIELFGSKIEPTASPNDPDGEWLVFVPSDAGDAQQRVVFETDASATVVRYRTGRLPEVLYTNGCADAA